MNAKVPWLTTALTGPLQQLESIFLDKQITIESWLREQWQLTPPPVYSSVDLRNAGFKLAPVDTNLFAAGFNNLNRVFLPLCIQAAQATFSHEYPSCKRILIIPENHTRNTFYFESLATLQEILQKAGYDARVGSLNPEITSTLTVNLPSQRSLTLTPIVRQGNRLITDDFNPCLILLNNDLSGEIPSILLNLEQPIRPRVEFGWARRLKSVHFDYYADVAKDFARLIGIDSWLIDPLFSTCASVDFETHEGEECLVEKVDATLTAIKKKYSEYHITEQPFVIVKADAGSYGLGVMTLKDAQEIKQLNRKQRTKMATTKGQQKVTKVIIQEGVYTFETWNNAVAEPVVYMIGQHVVGGFYRVHQKRGADENLNAPGMHFEPLAFAKPCNTPETEQVTNAQDVNRFYSYGLLARLAALAVARELANLDNQPSL
ncbi:MAG: glutamate--cysteine ligase [Gammaproteobacteria bacterium]